MLLRQKASHCGAKSLDQLLGIVIGKNLQFHPLLWSGETRRAGACILDGRRANECRMIHALCWRQWGSDHDLTLLQNTSGRVPSASVRPASPTSLSAPGPGPEADRGPGLGWPQHRPEAALTLTGWAGRPSLHWAGLFPAPGPGPRGTSGTEIWQQRALLPLPWAQHQPPGLRHLHQEGRHVGPAGEDVLPVEGEVYHSNTQLSSHL